MVFFDTRPGVRGQAIERMSEQGLSLDRFRSFLDHMSYVAGLMNMEGEPERIMCMYTVAFWTRQ